MYHFHQDMRTGAILAPASKLRLDEVCKNGTFGRKYRRIPANRIVHGLPTRMPGAARRL